MTLDDIDLAIKQLVRDHNAKPLAIRINPGDLKQVGSYSLTTLISLSKQDYLCGIPAIRMARMPAGEIRIETNRGIFAYPALRL